MFMGNKGMSQCPIPLQNMHMMGAGRKVRLLVKGSLAISAHRGEHKLLSSSAQKCFVLFSDRSTVVGALGQVENTASSRVTLACYKVIPSIFFL